jgi:pimeloyl-ACP methyl ester carboxylesterase
VPYADVDGARLYYEFNGNGETLVQVGGAHSGHEGYASVTPELARHFRVLDYDHRGYGLSDRPQQNYSFDVWADDLITLLDNLDIERCHVHGGSMGGFIAISFATKYPERVDKLIVNGAAAKSDTTAMAQFAVWKTLARDHGVDSRELALMLCTHAFSRAHLDAGGEELIESMRDVGARNVGVDVFCAACDAMITTDVRADLPKIKSPCLLMVGSQDVLTPVDQGPEGAGMRYIHEHVPGSELVILEGCGHGLLGEQPQQCIDAILRFRA